MTSMITSKSTRLSLRLSKKVVRKLALVKQGLHARSLPQNQESLQEVIRRVGLLQLDAINVVERSHFLVLLSRLGLYDKLWLDDLHYPKRRLVEQWAHAECLIPVEDFCHFWPAIRARRLEPINPRKLKALGSDYDKFIRSIILEVSRRGPVTSRDFDDPRASGGKWWDHKPAKIALDLLHYTGRLAIERRVKFQCVYNLPERVFAEEALSTSNCSQREFMIWVTLRGLGCQGVATAEQIADYYRQPVPKMRLALNTLQQSGRVLSVDVEGWQRPSYILETDLPLVAQIEQGDFEPTVTCLLSPFDSLIWHRGRVDELFDFHYRNEMYTPLARKKRVHGYYVMPILRRGKLVGRVDPKMDRPEHELLLQSITFENGVRPSPQLCRDVACAFLEFAQFHGAEMVRVGHVRPTEFERPLVSAIYRTGLKIVTKRGIK